MVAVGLWQRSAHVRVFVPPGRGAVVAVTLRLR